MPTALPVEFFAVVVPGLESLMERELKDWFPQLKCETTHGGVTIWATLEMGLNLNLVLKIPTRILLRVGQFTCRDFPKLYRKISTLNWKEWIDPTVTLEVQASSTQSRLKIKRRIEETAGESWQKYQKKLNVQASIENKLILYIRMNDNVCTLSLDTSGELLHKRGQRTHIGEAPLRETLAAALIELVYSHSAPDTRPVEVIDPMMGGGTILLEAATRRSPILSRDFPLHLFNAKLSPLPASPQTSIQSLVGFEADQKTLQAAQRNLKMTVPNTPTQLIHQDFFKSEPLPINPEKQRWVICNPPYNERLKVNEHLPDYYARLFTATQKIVHPHRTCYLLPTQALKKKLILPDGWKVLEKRPFTHGGIPVAALVIKGSAV